MYRTDAPAAYWRDQLFLWGPRVLFAILILVATHFIAKAVQWAVAKGVDKVPALKRHPDAGGQSVGTELGRLAYWLIWLVGLIAALQPLGLSGVLTPVTNLTNEVFAFLPRLLGAGLFFFAGLILARIVRHVIEAALGALNLERLLGRAGISIGEPPLAVDPTGVAAEGATPARSSIARAVGVTVSAVIIIFAAIAALQILQISAISDPATAMLNTIALAIPRVVAALVWLAIAFLIGRWVKTMLETVLPSLGFDNSVRTLGIMPASSNPSKVVGTIAMTAILLGAAIEAARQLGGDNIAALLFQITELGGKVIFGTVIIVVGLFLARILASLVGSSTGEAGYAQTIVKYAIIALFTAIGLTFMGLANEIVMMAFGLILGSAGATPPRACSSSGRMGARRSPRHRRRASRTPRPRASPKSASRRWCEQPPLPLAGGDKGVGLSVIQATEMIATSPPPTPPASGRGDRFASFVAIDWSGAKGKRHKGIAIAEARGVAAPRLVRPGHVWSRTEVLDWLLVRAAAEPTLFGFDFSFAPPVIERGEYLPGEPDVPSTACEFWAYVDRRAPDEDLGAASFLESVHRKHFYFGIADGVKRDFVRFRQCDARLNEQGGRKTASAFDAIGAAQVAKASFSGMRLLHRLDGKVAIWPMDPLPQRASAVVEIYTRIYLRRAGMSGKKLRSRSELNRALKGLGSPPARLRFEPDDHQTDALVTAAGMRALAADPRAFYPPGLTCQIARSEGWTFGVL